MLLYERPIRRLLNLGVQGDGVSEDLRVKAQRRVLKEPYFVVLLNLIGGLGAAVIVATANIRLGLSSPISRMGAFDALLVSTITATVAFFALEYFLNRWMAPRLFPEGRLYQTPGVWKISLRGRLIALFVAINLIPLSAALLTAYRTADSLELILISLFVTVPLYIMAGFILTVLMAGNLARSMDNLACVLRDVGRGQFSSRVKVTSNDEIGYVGDVVNEMTVGLRERDFIKDTFGKYVSNEIRDEVLSGRVTLDGELKEVTVLFADLRNFTPLAEANDPKTVVQIINTYFREMASAIQQNSGLVLQFIGDEIEAVFGAPLPLENHPVLAVRTALEMRRRLNVVNDQLKQQGQSPLQHGIGIHTGRVVAANIGSPDRLSYALVGDTVNLASRIQNLNIKLGSDILVSATTQAALGKDVALEKLPATMIKGKREPVEIFRVI